MKEKSIGEQELALLRNITGTGGATVGEVAEGFGASRNLARSTVLTMMERLRKKGLLSRRQIGGVYQYRARATSTELMRGIVQRFVERHLGGSVTPLLAYLSEVRDLTEAERRELVSIVHRIQRGRPEKP